MEVVQEAAAPSTKKAAPRRPPVLDQLRHAELLTVEQLAVVEPALKPSRVRTHLFYRKTNGLEASGAIVMDGARVLIRPKKFIEWLMAPKPTA